MDRASKILFLVRALFLAIAISHLVTSCGGGGRQALYQFSQSTSNGSLGKVIIPTNYTLLLSSSGAKFSEIRPGFKAISEPIPGLNALARFEVFFPAEVRNPLVAKIKFAGGLPFLDSRDEVFLARLNSGRYEIIGRPQETSEGYLILLYGSGEYALIKRARQAGELTSFAVFVYADGAGGDAPYTVNFVTDARNAQGTVTYSWQFGDGATSSEANPTHTYELPGTYTVLLACQDSEGNSFFTFSSPIVVTGAAVGQVSGTITNIYSGNPVSGLSVMLLAIDGSWVATSSDINGNYSFSSVSPGEYALVFSGSGYLGENWVITVGTEPVVMNVALTPSEFIRVAPPNFIFDSPPYTLDTERGIASISASVENANSTTVVRFLNGHFSLVPTILSPSGQASFNDVVILTAGTSTVRYYIGYESGIVASNEIAISWAPTRQMFFRATLTWDRGTEANPHDMDLHVYDPMGDESYYGRKDIPSGSLDTDNTTGFGPENFTCTTSPTGAIISGTYHVFVYYFNGTEPTNCTITLLLNPGTAMEQTVVIGPQVLYPSPDEARYWYAVDVNLDSAGNATYTTPGTPPPTVSLDLTGTWWGTWASNDLLNSGDFSLEITQTGTAIQGIIIMGGTKYRGSANISGSLSGNVITYATTEPIDGVMLTFEGTASQDAMGGTYVASDGDSGTWTASPAPAT